MRAPILRDVRGAICFHTEDILFFTFLFGYGAEWRRPAAGGGGGYLPKRKNSSELLLKYYFVPLRRWRRMGHTSGKMPGSRRWRGGRRGKIPPVAVRFRAVFALVLKSTFESFFQEIIK